MTSEINNDDLLNAMERGDHEYLVKECTELREALLGAVALNRALERKIVNRNRTIIHNGHKRRRSMQ